MMGCQTVGQERLFYSFNLEDHVPQNHLLRGIDRFLDLSELRQHLTDYYCVPGEEPINWGNPENAIRPVREYLAALDEANTLVTPTKAISPTDPASTWTVAGGRWPAIYAYSTNYLIDLKAGIIVDVLIDQYSE